MKFIYDPSLVLYLPLWKKDGNVFQSDDAYGHSCTVTGATWGLTGRTFNASNQKITVPNSTPLTISGAITISAWVNLAAVGTDQAIVYKGGNPWAGVDYMLYVKSADNKFYLTKAAGATLVESATPLTVGVWNFLTVTYDLTTAIAYLNGVFDNSAAISTTFTTSVNNLLIGNDPTLSDDLTGIVGEVMIYNNRALTPLKDQRNYLATKWRFR